MAYVFLAIAISAEIVATSLLGTTDGFTKPLPTAVCLALYIASFALLAQCIKDMPVGIAYAIWSGVGTATIVAIGVVFTGDTLTFVKAAGIAIIIAGVVMLNLGGAAH